MGTLIAGMGNLLLTDEGIGVHVARELMKMDLAEGVEVVDVGTAIFDLAALIEGKDKVIVVDACLSGAPAGTIHRLTLDELKSRKTKLLTSLHQYGLAEALESTALMTDKPEVIIFGVVPKDYRTPSTNLTDELSGSIETVVKAILDEVK